MVQAAPGAIDDLLATRVEEQGARNSPHPPTHPERLTHLLVVGRPPGLEEELIALGDGGRTHWGRRSSTEL